LKTTDVRHELSLNTGVVCSNPTGGMDVCVCLFFLCCPVCRVGALWWADSQSKESYRLCTGLRNWKSGPIRKRTPLLRTPPKKKPRNENENRKQVDSTSLSFRIEPCSLCGRGTILASVCNNSGAAELESVQRPATVWTTDGSEFESLSSRIFSSPHRPDRLWGPSSLLYNGAVSVGREADHSVQTSAEVKEVWTPAGQLHLLELYCPTPDGSTNARRCSTYRWNLKWSSARTDERP
jgi:hypothetical protein